MGPRLDPRRSPRARRARVVSCALLALSTLAAAAGGALAQSAKPAAPPPKGHTTARPAPPRKSPFAPDAGITTPVPPAGGSPLGPAPDAGVVEARMLDGGTRVYKFSELDIEGRLKSPQLVYFLRRVRAEFSAGDLGHRSFLREMSESRKEPTF